jgi:hypothetical protein
MSTLFERTACCVSPPRIEKLQLQIVLLEDAEPAADLRYRRVPVAALADGQLQLFLCLGRARVRSRQRDQAGSHQNPLQ